MVAYGQVGPPVDSLRADSLRSRKLPNPHPEENVNKQYDFGDLTRNILHPGRKPDTLHKGSGITVVPNVAANPTIGAQLGIKAVAGRKLGKDPATIMSVGATSASITTKGIIYFYINHNIFTPGNKWNLQGSLVAAKSVSPDHGLGIGRDYSGKAMWIQCWPTPHIKVMPSTLFTTTSGKRYTRTWQRTFSSEQDFPSTSGGR